MASQSSPIELGAAVPSRPRYFPDQAGLTRVNDGRRGLRHCDLGRPSFIPDGFPVFRKTLGLRSDVAPLFLACAYAQAVAGAAALAVLLKHQCQTPNKTPMLNERRLVSQHDGCIIVHCH